MGGTSSWKRTNLLSNIVEADDSSIKVDNLIRLPRTRYSNFWGPSRTVLVHRITSFSLGGAGHIKLSKELQSADANYWLKSGTTEWRIDYIGGTNSEEAKELEVETEMVLEPMKFVISGASHDQVKPPAESWMSGLVFVSVHCSDIFFSLMENISVR